MFSLPFPGTCPPPSRILFPFPSPFQFGSESQWCKTALWFDWLFFDPVTQFYTLEPALAVVRYCIGVQATKASSLLEYLIKQAKEIYPPLQGRITIAMNTAMKTMADFLTTK